MAPRNFVTPCIEWSGPCTLPLGTHKGWLFWCWCIATPGHKRCRFHMFTGLLPVGALSHRGWSTDTASLPYCEGSKLHGEAMLAAPAVDSSLPIYWRQVSTFLVNFSPQASSHPHFSNFSKWFSQMILSLSFCPHYYYADSSHYYSLWEWILPRTRLLSDCRYNLSIWLIILQGEWYF